MSSTTERATTELILNQALPLLSKSGYASFRYRDLAEALGLSQAAIHYHFGRKDELICAAIDHYAEATRQKVVGIASNTPGASERMDAYVEIYAELAEAKMGNMCPGGILAAELAGLPRNVQNSVRDFFGVHATWLIDSTPGPANVRDDKRLLALQFIAALEGGLILARAFDDAQNFRAIAGLAKESFLSRLAM